MSKKVLVEVFEEGVDFYGRTGVVSGTIAGELVPTETGSFWCGKDKPEFFPETCNLIWTLLDSNLDPKPDAHILLPTQWNKCQWLFPDDYVALLELRANRPPRDIDARQDELARKEQQ